MRVNALFQLQGLVYEKTNSFLTIKATQLVPMNVADQYNQRSGLNPKSRQALVSEQGSWRLQR